MRVSVFVATALLGLGAPDAPAAAESGEPFSPQTASARAFRPVPLRTDTPSGLPVPRFVALKHRKTNCRSGPSFEHATRYTFLQKGMPVLVVAETVDHWRKVRDRDGDECWTHQTVLRAPTHAVALRKTLLKGAPSAEARTRAIVGANAMVRLEKVDGDWVRAAADGVSGWAPAADFWGVRPPLAAAADSPVRILTAEDRVAEAASRDLAALPRPIPRAPSRKPRLGAAAQD